MSNLQEKITKHTKKLRNIPIQKNKTNLQKPTIKKHMLQTYWIVFKTIDLEVLKKLKENIGKKTKEEKWYINKHQQLDKYIKKNQKEILQLKILLAGWKIH